MQHLFPLSYPLSKPRRRSRRAAAKIPEPAPSDLRLLSPPPRMNRIGPQDVELLFTAIHFTDVVEYLAVPDSICTPRALAVIQVGSIFRNIMLAHLGE